MLSDRGMPSTDEALLEVIQSESGPDLFEQFQNLQRAKAEAETQGLISFRFCMKQVLMRKYRGKGCGTSSNSEGKELLMQAASQRLGQLQRKASETVPDSAFREMVREALRADGYDASDETVDFMIASLQNRASEQMMGKKRPTYQDDPGDEDMEAKVERAPGDSSNDADAADANGGERGESGEHAKDDDDDDGGAGSAQPVPPRPKTSRRVREPTPSEYTDYLQDMSAPKDRRNKPTYTIEQATIHEDSVEREDEDG